MQAVIFLFVIITHVTINSVTSERVGARVYVPAVIITRGIVGGGIVTYVSNRRALLPPPSRLKIRK